MITVINWPFWIIFVQIPFLIDVNEGFLRMTSVHVQQLFFGPGEYLVRIDDLAKEIYYIKNGKVGVTSLAV